MGAAAGTRYAHAMKSRVLWVVLLMLLTTAIAYLLLAGLQLILTGDIAEALSSAATMLFQFMDVGLVAFLIVLILFARWGWFGFGRVVLAALLCTVVNAIVVLVVGLIQGGWGALMVLFAIEAGVAVLLAVLIAAPLARRLAKPNRIEAPA